MDRDRDDWRTFRLDRIADPRPTKFTFKPRKLPGGDAATFVTESLRSIPMKFRVVATVHAPAEEITDKVYGGKVEPLGKRRCQVSIDGDQLEWLAFQISSLGVEFQIHEPKELVDYLAQLAGRVTRSIRSASLRFYKRYWEPIARGEITVAFRRWQRPMVVAGRRYRTAGTIIEVDRVDLVDPGDVTDDEARAAGHTDAASLLTDFGDRDGFPLYRIHFHLAEGPDPRARLAEDDSLSDDDLAAINLRLERLDRASTHGPWTNDVLRLIEANPSPSCPRPGRNQGHGNAPVQGRCSQAQESGSDREPPHRLPPLPPRDGVPQEPASDLSSGRTSDPIMAMARSASSDATWIETTSAPISVTSGR